jgi:signal transduction histidine kinase
MKNTHPHFEVHPSVVYQLGESLISDSVQALIELVKNCYDADATYAKVIIDTNGSIDLEGAVYPSNEGLIIVEDDGHGMDIIEIEEGWLTISNRKKRELKQGKKTTPGGRTPLGDKGLGRLGVQRLGDNLEIFTKTKNASGYHLGFSWLDFQTAPKLENVDIHLEEAKYPHKHGTKVVVSGLKEPEIWRGQGAVKRLEHELSQMISPYRQIRDFSVLVEVDGKRLELLDINDQIRDIAPIRYNLSFDGMEFIIQGRARLDFFRPSSSKDAEQFTLIAESDDGKAFFDYLHNQKRAQTLGLTRSRSRHWFVEFCWKKELADIDKVHHVSENSNNVANPGPFVGEVDSFDLGAAAFKNQSVFDGISEYRRYIKELSGIRVYRDGFAIRVDHDWLKLGAQWTSAPSYYGLKPDNTLGYVALSARDNMELEETTDREGFKDSAYYRNFGSLMEEFKKFTTEVHDFFGRSWTEFRKIQHEKQANVDSRKSVEDISQTIKTKLGEATDHQEQLQKFTTELGASALAAKGVVSVLRSVNVVTPELREQAAEVLSDLEVLIGNARATINHISTFLKEIASMEIMGQVLQDRVEGLRRQMDDMYEAVALGLTAEALSHEVYNVADHLAARAKSIQTTVRNKGITDRTLLVFIEYVHSSVLALRKQLSFLSPSLRYVRDQRHEVNIQEFTTEFIEFYRERLAKNQIRMKMSSNRAEPFIVRINKGKLTQVIDNLVLNSEYWLKEDIIQNRIKTGTIYLDISHPFIRIYDDGSGIDPNVEYTIFEPFISTKAKGQGRGLGLFIVKQLLDSEGCSIGLLPERNRRRRLFKFQIDLRSIIHE